MTTVIRTRLVRIGNSQGIRIPKVMLDQLDLTDTIELEVRDNQLVVRAARTARADWAAQFQKMAERQDDQLLDPDVAPTSWEETEWEW
ncbi:MAG TPA: AbrB/MazE/SpoVT family DNA-binding domain-containing protein [Roseiflexaceae bacterium]|nr:AbrB/MazE/SpoVT family DNA-binding domain-containing protein [Roseiflexaceae bacterium]